MDKWTWKKVFLPVFIDQRNKLMNDDLEQQEAELKKWN